MILQRQNEFPFMNNVINLEGFNDWLDKEYLLNTKFHKIFLPNYVWMLPVKATNSINNAYILVN